MYAENFLDCMYGACLLDPSFVPTKKAIFGPSPFQSSQWNSRPILMNLYDLKLLGKLVASGSQAGNSFTVKQRAILLKFISKYRNQLENTFELPEISEWLKEPKWKYPERVIIKGQNKISVIGNYYHLKFDYDKKIIEFLRGPYIHNLRLDLGWDAKLKVWRIEISPITTEIVRRLMSTLQGFEISPGVQEVFEANTFPTPEKSVVSLMNGCLKITCNNKRQYELAEDKLNSDESIYQKINYLAYLNFAFDQSVTKYLLDQGLVNWQIDMLTSQSYSIDYSVIPLAEIDRFLQFIKLGVIVGNSLYARADFFKFWTGPKLDIPQYETRMDGQKYDYNINYLIKTAGLKNVDHTLIDISSTIGYDIDTEIPLYITRHDYNQQFNSSRNTFLKKLHIYTSVIENQDESNSSNFRRSKRKISRPSC